MPAAKSAALWCVPLVLAAALASGCTSQTTDPTDGAGLVQTRCSRCHPIDRVLAARKDQNGWTATVDRMIAHGVQLTDQQRATVIDYLTKRDASQ